MLVLDFETRSRVDLKTAGTYNYIADPSTQIICLCATDMLSGQKWEWYPNGVYDTGVYDTEIDADLYDALLNADKVAAHYAEFDMGIYEYIAVEDHGFPAIPHDRWYCTAAQCRVNNIPAGLAEAAWSLRLTTRKHPMGADLIKKLSIPQKDGTFNYDPKLIKDMGIYCAQDVATTVAVVKATRPMTTTEYQDWYANTLINERGVKVDTGLATLALQYASAEQDEIAVEFKEITKGVVERHTQNQRIKKWIVGQVPDKHPLIDLMTVYKKGVKKLSLDKAIRGQILGKYADNDLDVPAAVIYAIELLDDGNKSSVAKFKRMLERADPEDSRVRGAFVFAGASQTLRYASRGLQLHNMRRECWTAEETENLKLRMARSRPCLIPDAPDMSVMEILAKSLRPAIIPAVGKKFVVGDWSAIEAMVLPWLSDSDGGEDKLDRFRRGEDTYVATAIDMGLGDEDNSRQIGKVCELALGFSGGVGAFQSMARNFGLRVSDPQAQILVDKWRSINPWAMDYARGMNRAAMMAIGNPHRHFPVGMVDYYFDNKLMGGTLMCIMPGDHIIQYPQCRMERQTTPWGDVRMGIGAMKAGYTPKADATDWPRVKLWPGLLIENATQAFAAALLRNAIRQLPDVIAHVHDEIVLEVPEKDAEKTRAMLKSTMVSIPEWAEGLPLKAEPVIMSRYGK